MTAAGGRIRMLLTTVFVAILLAALVLIVKSGPSASLLIALVLSGGGLALLVRWHAHRTRYTCPACGEVFQVTSLTDFVSAHTPERKLLRCPRCGETDWCRTADWVH